MPRRHKTRLITATLMASAVCTQAHALERLTLANGFTLDCARHEPLDATHTRVYLGSDTSYQDLTTANILSIDTLPDTISDPPKPAVAQATPAPTPAPTDIPTLLAAASALHHIDVDLLAAVIHAESNGRTTAVSRTGARGLMQLMPGTARDLGVQDAFQPGQNINGGTSYLDALLTRFHDDARLALAAYNAGPAAVDRYHGIPPFRETRAYVARILNEYNHRKLAQKSK